MAEDTMVKEPLTDSMIDIGETVVRKLNEMGLPISAAFWFFDAEINQWLLRVASSEVVTKGPQAVYGRIREAIDQLGPQAPAELLWAVRVLEPDAELVKLLRLMVRTGPGISRVRCTRNAVNGRFIDDVLIYRTV